MLAALRSSIADRDVCIAFATGVDRMGTSGLSAKLQSVFTWRLLCISLERPRKAPFILVAILTFGDDSVALLLQLEGGWQKRGETVACRGALALRDVACQALRFLFSAR